MEEQPEIVQLVQMLVDLLAPSRSRLKVEAPLTEVAYPETVKLVRRMGIPLDKTWSCYQAGPRTCKSCEGCRARDQAMGWAGMVEPLGLPVETFQNATNEIGRYEAGE